MVIDSSAVDTNTEGNYTVTYNATDSAGNVAVEVTRTVQVVLIDNIAPVITLSGDNPQIIELGQAYTELNASSDDGSTVVIDSSAVDTNTEGNYSVTYNATDTAGNVAIEVIRTVQVVDTTVPDTTAPIITLLGNPTETIEINTSYTDAGATASDNGDGDITANHRDKQSSGYQRLQGVIRSPIMPQTATGNSSR